MTQEKALATDLTAPTRRVRLGCPTKDKNQTSGPVAWRSVNSSLCTANPITPLFPDDAKALGDGRRPSPPGTRSFGVEEQSTKYVTGVPASLPAWHKPLPFCYESTGTETFFTNRLDPDPRSRRVFSFHRPETLLAWVQRAYNDPLCVK